jgi:hypothetical protein
MNILYILQQSIYNNNGKWLTADSNIQMMCGMLREVTRRTNWKFYVLIGRLEDFADIKSYDEIFKHENVNFIPYKFPVDAFLNRQHFSVFEFDELMKNLPKIDVVWNNITEASRNIKTYLYYKKLPAKLISSCYWLDTPQIPGQNKVPPEISYQWRQFDGFECSDLVSFTCNSTINAFIKNAEHFFHKGSLMQIINKATIWDFGYSQKEMDQWKVNSGFYIKKILFLNRLSGINYTHHEEFIKAANELYDELGGLFEVIFTNPSQKYSWDQLKSMVKPLKIYSEKPLTREEYIKLLWSSDASVHLYASELYGGCSHRESLHCNNVVITPKVFEYERIQGQHYPYYVREDLKDLKDVLRKVVLNGDFYKIPETDKILERNRESSFEVVAEKVVFDINQLIEGKA